MIIYSGCKSTKKILFTLCFLVFFFATACIADFHISFASQCSSKYIGVREIRHTEKVTSRFANSCPRLWASVPMYVGMETRVRGYEYPWAWAELFCFSALLTRAWQ